MATRICWLLMLGLTALHAAEPDGSPPPAAYERAEGAKAWDEPMETGRTLLAEGRYQEALTKLNTALERIESAGEKGYPLVMVLSDLGACYMDLGRYVESETRHRRAVRESQGMGPRLVVAVALNNYGVLLNRLGRTRQATEYFERSLDIRRELLGPRHVGMARQVHNLGRLFMDNEDFERAEPLLLEALSIWEEAPDRAGDGLAAGLNSMASLYSRQGRSHEALPLAERAVTVAEQALGPQHPTFSILLNNLAAILIDLDQYERAEPLVKQALAVAQRTLGDDHPETAAVLTNYASILKQTEHNRQARDLRTQARDILTNHVERNLLDETVDVSEFVRKGK